MMYRTRIGPPRGARYRGDRMIEDHVMKYDKNYNQA